MRSRRRSRDSRAVSPTLREEAPAGARWVADTSKRILSAEHLGGEGAEIQERAGAMGVIVETQRHR